MREKSRDALPLIEAAMEKIEREDEWYSLGQIGQTIQSSHPDFDTRTYGHAKLSALVREITEIETRKDGNQLMIRLQA